MFWHPSLISLALALALTFSIVPVGAVAQHNFIAGEPYELNDNGAWSWFMDERAIIDNGRLIVGSVRSVGDFRGGAADPAWGNIEVSVLNLTDRQIQRAVLHQHLEQDDHDGPAFYVRPDNRYLAVYSKHAVERKVYYRISEPHDPTSWGEQLTYETPGTDRRYGGDNVTYSNLFLRPDGRLFNFFRGFSHDPNYLWSDDHGTTWHYGGRVFQGRDGYSPYLKYAAAPDGSIHMVTTEDHPRNFDNSLYHGFLRDGTIHHSDGRAIAQLSTTQEPSASTWDLTRVFRGDPDNVAWMCDMEVDSSGKPYIAFSVQKDGRGLPPRQGGQDIRYHYARWDGNQWHSYEMAHAGTRLYPFEDDYSGLVALHPHDPNVVFISTDADPQTGAALISETDGKRHYEIFQGTTSDGGSHWNWQPITAHSSHDNLRPIVPKWQADQTVLVWMRGSYRHNHGQWTTAVMATILPGTPTTPTPTPTPAPPTENRPDRNGTSSRHASDEPPRGIAAEYPGDAHIDRDPRVVWVEDFEVDAIDTVVGRWDAASAAERMELSDTVPSASADNKSLLTTHVGGDGTGCQLYRRLPASYDRVHARFYVRFDKDCAPLHHFGTCLGGNNPPTPWPQVRAGQPTQGDRAFWVGIEPFGKSWRWDYYTYWCDMRGSPPRGQTWGNSFIQDPQLQVRHDAWTCVELMIKMNDVEDTNGELALWIDGQPVSHLGKGFPHGKWMFDKFYPGKGGEGVRWNFATGQRETTSNAPDGEPFPGFRWRTDAALKVNFLWAYVYITDAPAGHVSKIWFDNIVVATDYIGPIATPQQN